MIGFFFDIWTTSQFSSYLPFQDERKMFRVCRPKKMTTFLRTDKRKFTF